MWASQEADVSPRMHEAALHATGDDTIRSQVMDLARKLEWPAEIRRLLEVPCASFHFIRRRRVPGPDVLSRTSGISSPQNFIGVRLISRQTASAAFEGSDVCSSTH